MDFTEIFLSELSEKSREAKELISKIKEENEKSYIKDLYRIFHTLKGSASLVEMKNFSKLFHKIESYFKEKSENEEIPDNTFLGNVITIISNISNKKEDLTESELSKFSDILDGKISIEEDLMISEKDIFEISEISEFISQILEIENTIIRNDLKTALNQIKNLKKNMLEILDSILFTDLESVLNDFKELVQKEAKRYGKKINVKLNVKGVKIEKKDVKDIINILVHLARNAVAHGIETPEERKKIGKNEIGNIEIKAYIKQNKIFIEISDDGRGIDYNKIEEKIKKLNLDVSPQEAIFLPGFSSKDEADELSGRGIGLDMVKNFSTLRGGDVKVESEKNKGTKFTIFFEIKNFITKVLILKDEDMVFSIETSDIIQLSKYEEVIDGKILLSNKVYDVIYNSKKPKFVVITQNDKALVVENIIGIFDGKFVPEELSYIKGFVKNIFPYPIPVIDIEKFNKHVKTSQNHKKILIIDDSVITRKIISNFLEKSKFKTETAKDGIEGLKKLENKHFDLIISDVEMPNLDGFELTKKIKKTKKNIPIILLSTLTKNNLSKALESGADAFISKDESPQKIVNTINKLLGDANE
ncbi:chemotaxis protein CheA [Thermosipho affectus]|uniref:histidine kinase n=1 Tax=Thermosipho affectus TaxID=660294 RepID=A0ABX3IGI4_9BACT|nr:response regulator [Thermosipho affectus]ONN26941.1 chemotaxis protein CheA [Thermosipho affectus]